MRKKRENFTPEEDAEMHRLAAMGWSSYLIATQLGRIRSSVYARMKKLSVFVGVKIREVENTPPAIPVGVMKASRGETAGYCKCLGGCGRTFKSPDRMRIRICPGCKKLNSRKVSGLDVFSLCR